MECRVFRSAREMQAAAAGAAEGGSVVLTPTARLAKRYRHERRMRAVRGEAPVAWQTPPIYAWTHWVRALYATLWEARAPLPLAGQLRFWAQACEEVPGNPGFALAPALYVRLQRTYDRLCQRGAERGPEGGEGLVGWRSGVFRRFESLVRDHGYRCWDGVLHAVRRAAAEGRLALPRALVLVIREELEPADLRFFEAFAAAGIPLEVWRASRETAQPPCRVYATPEQECRAVCHEVLEAWEAARGKAYLGVVALDAAYFPILRRCLEELSGREGTPEGTARYNLAWGDPLPLHPLYQTALLPLRLGGAENPPALLASLLCSPFVNRGKLGLPAHRLREALWTEGPTLDLAEALQALHLRGGLDAGLRRLALPGRRPLRRWIEELDSLWSELGFPHRPAAVSQTVRDEVASAWEGFARSAEALRGLAGDILVSADETAAWFRAACENRRVVAPGAESGGIQVVGPAEAPGIPFDRLWMAGCHGGVLPAPPPSEPLLTAEEAREVAGVSHEESWKRAERDLCALSALCEDTGAVAWSRAFAAPGGDPFLPSPLLQDCFERRRGAGRSEGMERAPFVFDVWGRERGAWLAAPWMAGASRGLARPEAAAPPPPSAVAAAIPAEIRVTRLGALLWCPFSYFAFDVLGLAPLPAPSGGIAPRERGIFVHAVVKAFLASVEGEVPEWPDDEGGAWLHLRRVVEGALASKPATPDWRAERRRLLGEDAEGTLGVMRAWLEAERVHRREGWKPLAGGLEAAFSGLALEGAPIRVRGTVDRVDVHDELGWWVLDYKTGAVPAKENVVKHHLEPQLPAYAAAVAAGLVGTEGGSRRWEGPVTAGYVVLHRPAEVEIAPFRYRNRPFDLGTVAEWEKATAARLSEAARGLFPALPRPDPSRASRSKLPCVRCKMEALCGFYDDPTRHAAGEGEEEG